MPAEGKAWLREKQCLKSAGGIAGYFQIKWEYKYIKEGMGLYELGCTYKR